MASSLPIYSAQIESLEEESWGDETPTEADDKKRRTTVAPAQNPPTPRKTLAGTSFQITEYDNLLKEYDFAARKNFLMNPLPAGDYMQCFIVREKTGLTKLQRRFVLKTEQGTFVAACKKVGGLKKPYYLISMDDSDMNRDGINYAGKVRWNLTGSTFIAYSAGENYKSTPTNSRSLLSVTPRRKNQPVPSDSQNLGAPAPQTDVEVREELVNIRYNAPAADGKPHKDGPRSMRVVIPFVDDMGKRTVCRPTSDEDAGLVKLAATQAKKPDEAPVVIEYTNRPAAWNESSKTYVLNFSNRVKVPSVKNFQMILDESADKMTYLQFGRVSDDYFALDFGHPISPFQAFSIALSSLDYKMCTV